MCGVLFGLYLLYRSEVEHHLPALSFQIKVKNKRLKRHTCLKALQDKGFAGGVLFAQTPHMPPKRHPNATRLACIPRMWCSLWPPRPLDMPRLTPNLAEPTNRAGSSIEPAPVPPWPPRGHHVATTASPCGHPVATMWPPLWPPQLLLSCPSSYLAY